MITAHQFFKSKINRLRLASVFFISLFIVVGFFLLCYFFINYQLGTYFLKIFETKSFSQLETYHDGNIKILQQYFNHLIQVESRLLEDKDFKQTLMTKNLIKVQEILDRQQIINGLPDMWTIFDAQGKLIVVSSANPEFNKYIGKDFSGREYFQQVMKKKKICISSMFSRMITEELAIVFSLPINNQNNQLLYVFNAHLSLKNLQAQLIPENILTNYYFILLDRQGNILLENNIFSGKEQNIRDKERLLSTLLSTRKKVFSEEINYKGEKVLAIADFVYVNPDKDSDFIVISYHPKSEFDGQQNGLTREIRRVYFGLTAIYILLFVFGWLIVVEIFSYEKK
jgi:C4-dicarboxylate-specific signal transduction histidine kinase